MKSIITKIESVRKHPDADRLTLNKVVVDGQEIEVVANLKDDGSPRWKAGETVVYIPENVIVPHDVLRERGYWDDVKNKGLLGGSKGDRVKMQRFAGFESRGIIFKLVPTHTTIDTQFWLSRGDRVHICDYGDDVSGFLDLKEYVQA